MADIFCAKCGEPWDSYHVRHDMSFDERARFLAGQGCDSCGFGTKCVDCSGSGRHQESNKCKNGLAHCPDCPDDVPPCPVCEGTGEFVSPDLEDAMLLRAVESAMDASDDEPLSIVANYGLL